MKTKIALLLILFPSLFSFAATPGKEGIVQMSNLDVVKEKHINDVFKKLGMAGCKGKEVDDFWGRVLKIKKIDPCSTDGDRSMQKIPASESGILSETKKEGSRSVHQIKWMGCNGKPYWLRFTYDLVHLEQNKRLCGFEIFIRSYNAQFVGVAVDKDGNILKEVPEELAFDKHDNKIRNKKVKSITSGQGCFECHPSASTTYNMPEAEKFWNLHELPMAFPLESTPHKNGDAKESSNEDANVHSGTKQ